MQLGRKRFQGCSTVPPLSHFSYPVVQHQNVTCSSCLVYCSSQLSKTKTEKPRVMLNIRQR